VKATGRISALLSHSASRRNRTDAATPASSRRAAGSGAPSRRPLLALATAVALTLVLGATLASAAKPTLTIEAASDVTSTTAEVEGSVDPQGQPTTYRFQYITDAAYNTTADAQQNLVVAATAGTYTLEFKGQITGPLAFDASAAEVQAALNALPSIGGVGGSVTVSGGPGDESGSAPYAIAFAGSLAQTNVEGGIAADPSALAGGNAYTEITTQGRGVGFDGAESQLEGSTEVAEALTGQLSGLQPNTTYHLRLQAENPDGTENAVAPATFTTEAPAPVIAAAPYTPLSSTSVRLRAYLNPHNSALSDCHFAYSTDASFAQSAPCDQDPSGNEAVEVSAELTGLDPGAPYNFRLVAASAAGPASGGEDATFEPFEEPAEPSCSNEALREKQGSTALPDCRAYEMVSPPDKIGGDVITSTMKTRIAPSGDAVVFTSLTAFGDAVGTGLQTDYASTRGPDGWETHSLLPIQEPQPLSTVAANYSPFYDDFSEDLSTGVLFSLSPLTDAPHGVATRNLYRRDDVLAPGAGDYTLLTQSTSFQGSSLNNRPTFVAASSDFTHILFESKLNLVPEVTPCPAADPTAPLCDWKLYEWDHGTVRLAGVLPEGQAATCADGQVCSSPGRGFSRYGVRESLSPDGSRVFFSSPVDSVGLPTVTANLYMREDHETTVQINASEPGTPVPGQFTDFQETDADGEKVFFTSGSNLYVYDASRPDSDPDNLTLLASSALGVIGSSDDGSYVYFLAGNQLVPGAPTDGPPSLARIFVWHDGDLRYLGALDNSGFFNDHAAAIGGFNPGLGEQTARVTPDGRHLVFTAHDGTYLGDDSDHGAGCGRGGDIPCNQVYAYDYGADGAAGRLSCVSCNPSGAPALADASTIWESGRSNTTSTPYLNHPLTDDGSRLFFSSGEALVPEDTNQRQDAYQYDTDAGRLQLLSSGTDPADSVFLEATPSGDDVLIASRQRLLGIDFDQSLDLYEARVRGGIAAQSPAAAAPECLSDSCQGAPSSSQPPRPTPASAGLRGPGDPNGRGSGSKCPKHKRLVHRKGKARCVKVGHRPDKKHRADHERRAGR
jgi:hypothetical protein